MRPKQDVSIQLEGGLLEVQWRPQSPEGEVEGVPGTMAEGTKEGSMGGVEDIVEGTEVATEEGEEEVLVGELGDFVVSLLC